MKRKKERKKKRKKEENKRKKKKKKTLLRNHLVFMHGRVSLLLMTNLTANSTSLANTLLTRLSLFWRTAASIFILMSGIWTKQKEMVSMCFGE